MHGGVGLVSLRGCLSGSSACRISIAPVPLRPSLRSPSAGRQAAGAQWRLVAATAPAGKQLPPPQRVAVIGGGFAGLAASWHLLELARLAGSPMQLHLFDAFGLGAGGSGAAAGLLHPFTPRGKVLWRGVEAFQEATALLAVAEASAAADVPEQGAGVRRPFVWRQGMLRPARSAKQARDVARFLAADPAAAAATGARAVTDPAALAALVPGLQPEQLLPAEQLEQAAAAAPSPAARQRRRQPQQSPHAAATPPAVGLLVGAGATVHPGSYMRALWLACQHAAAAAGPGSCATLRQRAAQSLRELQAAEGPFDAIVVAAGAAAGSIEELRGVLPLELCHGYSLDMQPGSHAGSSSSSSSSGGTSGGGSDEPGNGGGGAEEGCPFPEGAPSLLGSPYLAAHGSRSLVVGATKRYGLTPEQALQQCGAPLVADAAEAAAAADALLPAAAGLWPPLAGWSVARVRAGVRALPTCGADGAIPYAGCLPAADGLPRCWVVGGLGARGLVYHAWLGKLVAAAVAAGSDEALPPELLRWKSAGEDTQ